MDAMSMLLAGVMIIAAIAGILMIFVAKKAFKNPALKNAFVVPIILFAVAGFTGYFGGYDAVVNYTPEAPSVPSGTFYTPSTTPTTSYQTASFSITPSVNDAGNTTLNGAETMFSRPAIAWTTSHTIKDTDNTTFTQPSMKFIVTPEPWTGAQTTNTAVVYYEYGPIDQTINPTSGGNYYFITSSSGRRQAIWYNSDWTVNQFGSGFSVITIGSTATVYLNLTLSTDSCSRIDNLFDPILSTITFHNADYTWSQTYTFSFFLTEQRAL